MAPCVSLTAAQAKALGATLWKAAAENLTVRLYDRAADLIVDAVSGPGIVVVVENRNCSSRRLDESRNLLRIKVRDICHDASCRDK